MAALQTLLFLITFVLAGAAGLVIVRRAELRAAHAELEELEDDFTDRLMHLGVQGAVTHFEREHRDAGRDFRVEDAAGRWLGGGFPVPPRHGGDTRYWATFAAPATTEPARPPGPALAYVHPEPGGVRLVVGEFLSVRERHDDDLLLAIMLVAGGVAGAGMLIGVFVAQRVQRRIDVMSRAVERFGAGDRNARIGAVGAPRSDLEDLGHTLDRMMDRENQLVEGLKQATWSIAHDLRRPLTHHNQAIAQALQAPCDPDRYRAALQDAAARVDEVLETFQALLHIAELEAGAPGLQLSSVDLGAVAARVVEAYRPAAEEGGRRLELARSASATIQAEPRVLGRMIANLVENALAYTPVGSRVVVAVDAAGPRLSVTDNGPGVAAAYRERIFERFFRVDSSRSSDGAGLGLALASAAARAFGGRLWAEDAGPGLRIVADFSALPAGAPPPPSQP